MSDNHKIQHIKEKKLKEEGKTGNLTEGIHLNLENFQHQFLETKHKIQRIGPFKEMLFEGEKWISRPLAFQFPDTYSRTSDPDSTSYSKGMGLTDSPR